MFEVNDNKENINQTNLNADSINFCEESFVSVLRDDNNKVLDTAQRIEHQPSKKNTRHQKTESVIVHNATRSDSLLNLNVDNENVEFGDIKNINQTIISHQLYLQEESKKNSLFNNIKFLYDQNADRTRKRTEQMKRMCLFRKTNNSEMNYGESKVLKEYSSHNLVLTTMSNTNSNTTHENVNINTNITFNKFRIPHEANENDTEIEENKNINNDDAEVMVSDLDFTLEKEGNENLEQPEKNSNVTNITKTQPKSFVQIKNHLVAKNIVKEDNATSSYLLALEYDSLDNTGEIQNKITSSSNKEVHHVRLPSGKNYLINSVIEEEISDTYTDSEISNRKRSYMSYVSQMFSKNKDSDRKFSDKRTPQEISTNLDKVFYNVMPVKRFTHHSNSKSELITNKPTQSEIFNLQFDIKKTFESISKKKSDEDKLVRMKVENKKKELIDKFFHNKPAKKIFNDNNPFAHKKSVSTIPSLTREIYYEDNIINSNLNSEKKLERIPEEDLSKNYKDDFEIKMISPIKIAIEEPNINYKAIKEKYKHERKKSSIFKSEDLRISKIGNVNINNNEKIEKSFKIRDNSIPEQCSYININNNINICSPISIHSIQNCDKKVTDKTVTNPFELIKNNSSNDICEMSITSSSNNKGRYFNLNLTISKNENLDTSNIVKRKLFQNNCNFDIEKLTVSNEILLNFTAEKQEKKTLSEKENITTIQPIKIIKDLTTSINKTKTNEFINRNRKCSLDFLQLHNLQNTKNNLNLNSNNTNVVNIINKHAKTPSLNLGNIFNENIKRKIANLNTNTNFFFGKARSNSDSTTKAQNQTQVLESKHNRKNSTISINNKKSPAPNSCRLNTPSLIKNQNYPDKNCISLSANKNFLNFNRNLDNRQSSKTPIVNNDVTQKIKFGTNNPNNIPKLPKKKMETYRTNSEISFGNIVSEPPINKLKIIETLRYLKYPKSINKFDHHKLALEKLVKSKGNAFIILVEKEKGNENYYVIYIIFI